MSFTGKFNKITRRLRKVNANSLVALSAVKIREVEQRSAPDYQGWLPWNLLLLMRWGIEFGRHEGGVQADEQMLASLMNDAQGLLAVDPYLQDKTNGGIEKFFRRVAYQQFWFQRSISKMDFGRLWLLHRDIPEDGEIAKALMEASGLSVKDFVAMCAIVWAIDTTRPGVPLTLDLLDESINIDRAMLKKFMACVSTTISAFNREVSRRKGAVRSRVLQVHERTPFLRYPLLREGEAYLVVSKRVLGQSIIELPWRVARERRGNDAAVEYGFHLERYVEKGLTDSAVRFKNEAELRAICRDSKVSDFCLFGEDQAVVIETKSVEIRPCAALNPINEVLWRELEDNVLKGIVQGFSTATAIARQGSTDEDPQDWRYSLWILTPGRLLLGPGISAWEELLGSPVERALRDADISDEIIPPGRIHFLSLEEFDFAMSVVDGGSKALDRVATTTDQSGTLPGQRRYQFEQSLAELGELNAPDYLSKAHDELWDYAKEMFIESDT